MVLGRALVLIYLLVRKTHIFSLGTLYSVISAAHSQGNNKKTHL